MWRLRRNRRCVLTDKENAFGGGTEGASNNPSGHGSVHAKCNTLTPREQAERFLTIIFGAYGPDALIDFRTLGAGGPRESFYPNTPDGHAQVIAAAIQADKAGRDVYVGVLPRSRPDGSKAAVVTAGCIFADMDDVDDLDTTAWPFAPSVVVRSGGGFHLYWLFVAPVDLSTNEAKADFEAVLKALIARIGADDGAKDCSRILRVPGTVNHKPKRNGAKVTLEVCDPSIRYDYNVIRETLLPVSLETTAPEPEPKTEPKTDRKPRLAFDAWPSAETLIADALKPVTVHNRHERAKWLAKQCHDNGFKQADAEDAARRFARVVPEAADDPFTEEEAVACVEWAYTKTAKRDPWSSQEPAQASGGNGKQPPANVNVATGEIDDHRRPRPTLHEAAFYGVAGDLVQAVAPFTEADPAALLIQFLVGMGAAFGRGPHFTVSSTRHGTNLFVCHVAPTGDGKGLGMDIVIDAITRADPTLRENKCISTSHPSGESIPWAVRGPMEKQKPNKKRGAGEPDFIDYTEPGALDPLHRLLIRYSEFSEYLQVMAREGNSLSPTLRNAFDGSDLSTNGKTNPCNADVHHIGFLAGITATECRELMSPRELANGFANRFLWIIAHSARDIANPPTIQIPEPIIARLKSAVGFARKERRIDFDEQAAQAWAAVYPLLKHRPENHVGQATSRARVHVRRLALVYAVLDCSPVVTVDHLRAALAVWQFAEESAWYLFGAAIRDDDALLIAFIRESGGTATRTEVSYQHFQRNKSEEDIDAIRDRLLTNGRITITTDRSDGKAGRPAEVWTVPEGIISSISFYRRGVDYIATLDANENTLNDKTIDTIKPFEPVEPDAVEPGYVEVLL